MDLSKASGEPALSGSNRIGPRHSPEGIRNQTCDGDDGQVAAERGLRCISSQRRTGGPRRRLTTLPEAANFRIDTIDKRKTQAGSEEHQSERWRLAGQNDGFRSGRIPMLRSIARFVRSEERRSETSPPRLLSGHDFGGRSCEVGMALTFYLDSN